MGKYRECIDALTRLAKVGKLAGVFSVYPEEIPMLAREGFEVEVPQDSNCEGKNLIEVNISWENPSRRIGIARHLKKVVERYRHRQNSQKRTCKVVKAKREKQKAYYAQMLDWETDADDDLPAEILTGQSES